MRWTEAEYQAYLRKHKSAAPSSTVPQRSVPAMTELPLDPVRGRVVYEALCLYVEESWRAYQEMGRKLTPAKEAVLRKRQIAQDLLDRVDHE